MTITDPVRNDRDHHAGEHQSDAELLEATLDALNSTLPFGLDSAQAGAAAANLARTAVLQPTVAARQWQKLAVENQRIALGLSEIAPDPKDRRFSDEAWKKNPFLKRLSQSYLAWARSVDDAIDELDLDPKARLRADFLAGLATSALAPTNNLWTNPAALREAVKTNGESLRAGMRHLTHDAATNGGMPSMVDTRPFVPGETIAATPGAVVFTNPILEVIQYTPATADVHERPVMIIPPQINKYYVLDLAPDRSLVEYAVSQGQQVFMVSWRNPTPEHRVWDLDAYVSALIEASDAVRSISDHEDLNLMAVCAGGITAATFLGHLAAIGDERIHSATFLVTVLDWEVPSTMGSLMSGPVIESSRRRSQEKGMLPGEDLSRAFAWLRPNDLVWNYWVNNYLMGKNPPAFDVLAWNVDSTNLPSGLHNDFLEIAADNALTVPGSIEVLGTPIDLGQVTCPVFVVGAETDHITPWQGCYETVNLVGGQAEFVLSSQGHIQALVNPIGNPKGSYRVNPDRAESSETWLAGSEERPGSWWEYWTTWLTDRSGEKVSAPAVLGNDQYPAGLAAPGSYVLG